MSIEYYSGVPGVSMLVETPGDLAEALDILHTQVIDNIGEDSPLLAILERAMTEMEPLT